jgi:amino acid transporter
VAGVALLTDYVLTVASHRGGSDALASAFPVVAPMKHWIAIAFVIFIAYGNLRGTKESGKMFAVPTYFFIVNMFILIGVGILRTVTSSLPQGPTAGVEGMTALGTHHGNGLLMGATVFVVLKAFGSGGAAVTGVEAISNGVPAFRPPAWKNARSTLVIMGSLLGVMFLGLSMLAARTHAMPYEGGVPSVISQVGKLIYGEGVIGHSLFYALQAGTMLILVLAANTSFADFPRLASFHAGDNFMPRQLTIRGHRLVFSNGIIFLAIASIVTLLATGGEVSRLIPLYTIGVFTSFTLSQAGMAKHHITHKEESWRWGLLINGVGAFLSLLVLVIVTRQVPRRRLSSRCRPADGVAWSAQPGVRNRRRRTARRRPPRRGADHAHALRCRAGRQPRRGGRPRHSVRTDAAARRSTRRALRPRFVENERTRPGMGRPRLDPIPPRHRRMPRPPDATCCA